MFGCCVLLTAVLVLRVFFHILDVLLVFAWAPLSALRCACRRVCSPRAQNRRNSVREQTVVICGASFGGLAALRHLQDEPGLRIILIDQRTFFEYTPGILRAICEPQILDELAKPLPKGRHQSILGTVTNVQKDHVVVACPGGELRHVEFDYLVLAMGADYRQPITANRSESTIAARFSAWQAATTRLRGASSILVLGGGAVGAELAAEIACFHPEKHITIVDAQPHLVPSFPGQTVEYVENWFRHRGVDLILGEMLESFDDAGCVTRSGRSVRADLVFNCLGMKCNTQSVSAGAYNGELNMKGALQVNELFQVGESDNIFAVGDMMVHPTLELKQAYYAEANGDAVAMNILNHLAGRPKSTWVKYPYDICGSAVMPLVYVVSLGRYDGSLGFNKVVINGACAALVKWVIEWTKVKQMQGRPIGILVWTVGDWLTFLLSRTVLKPRVD